MIAPVSVGYARALLRHFGKTADQRSLLLRGTAIEESVLGQPSADIPASALVALAANITRRHGELWALEAGTVWSNSMQGALDVAVRTAPTVKEALAAAARFGSVRAPFIRAKLREATGSIRVEISPAFVMRQPVWRAIALAVGLNTHVLFAQILEDSIEEARLEFPWPMSSGSERLRSFFSCQVRFNARAFAVGFRQLLDGVLRERARAMSAAGLMSRDEMAAELGYADATSFSRACRRRFGNRHDPGSQA